MMFNSLLVAANPDADTLYPELKNSQDNSSRLEKLKETLDDDLSIREKIPYARQGLSLAQKNNDITKQLYFTMALGRIYQQLTIHDEAIGYYLQGLGMAKIKNDTLSLVKAYNALTGIYLENDLTGKARKFNNKALELHRNDMDDDIIGEIYELKGKIRLKNDDLFPARDCFAKAKQHFRKAGNVEKEIRQMILIAKVYEENQLYNQSLSALRSVKDRLGRTESMRLKARVHRNMARVLKNTNHYQDALSYVKKAEQLPHNKSYYADLVKTYQIKSSILESMGQKDEALQSYRRYMAMNDSLESHNTKQQILKLEVKNRAQQKQRKNRLLQAEVEKQRGLRDVFIGIAVIVFLTTAVIFIFLRYKKQKRRSRSLNDFNKQLEKRVKEKTRELELEVEQRIQKTNEAIRSQKKAEESDQLKTEFLNNISHEVRTPMNRIMGFSDLLLDEAPNLQVKDYAKVIYTDSQRLMKLITDLIELSKLKSENSYPDKDIFNLRNFLQEIYRKYEEKCPDELSFRINIPENVDDDFRIYSDKARLRNIIEHLLENALKFTHSGWIELGIKSGTSRDLAIYVSDTGVGIEKDQTDIIFDFFRKGKSSIIKENSGIGAGLTIVKHLTEILGGAVNLHTVHGQGSTFFLEFKKDKLKANGANGSGKNKNEVTGWYSWNGREILILDEQKSNKDFLEAALGRTGAVIKWARNEEEAIKELSDYDSIDLVILNEVFDNQHARKFVPKVKSICYTLPVIVQRSGFMAEFPWEAGADEFVTKPVSHKVLMEKIARLLKM
ncbi:MAG: hypothetical protein K9I68_11300 [Bacteroidales bacterium]|nr:hypothetical protein [Bacteroidales bacterium]MCF8339094.1 hypothetical protein [Bacteroidales bacterium]